MNSNSTVNTASSKSYTINSSTIQYGWKCPACGAVMAPWQNTCVNCSGHFTIGDRNWYTPGITWDQTTQVTCESNPNTTTSVYNNVAYTPTSSISLNYKELLNNNLEKMKKNI